ncbi:shikimate kinase [Sutterella seckii]|nr:shikimate kinase [Sutterella seckii]
MPGCGKTTVGKVVAARLMREFVDIDTLVEHRVGKSSQRIYREDGEEFFRLHETAVIESLAGQHGLVISTGGGACLKPRNRMLLALNGTFYWMQRPLSKLSTYNRPIPQARGVEALYEERAPIYRDLAERIITVKSVEATAAEIIGESSATRGAL